MNVLGRTVLAVSGQGLFRRRITEGRTGRSVSRRFVAGETLDDAAAVTRTLNTSGASVSLDHLGEHVTDKIEAERARDDYLAAIDRIAADGLDANVSVKLTQLGLSFDSRLAAESLNRLAARAVEAGITVSVDMEESDLVAATLDAYEDAQRNHGNLGVAIQAYLYRTPGDLKRLVSLGGHIRLCKGAYAEAPEVAYQKRGEVDDAFDALLRSLMAAPQAMPAIATHDDQRISLAQFLARERDHPWEFQMLYGVRPSLQKELVGSGFPLRVYVPYGDAWYPYLTRRLAERPANLSFFARALVGK